MAHQQIPRFEPPPPALSNMGSNNRASFISMMSEMSASSASAASAAAASSLSAELAQSTANTDDASESNSASQSQTVETFGIVVPASTPSNPAATQTDSNGSTITGAATTSAPSSTFSTSTTNSAASEHAPGYPGYPDSSLQTSDKGYHHGPSTGQIAAAVVIPLVVLLALGFGLFALRRRRRRRAAALASQPYHQHPMTDRSPFSKEAAVPKHPPPRHPNSSAAPILTSATNNTYYTGLSTPTTPSRASTQSRGRSNDSARPDGAAGTTASIYDLPPPAYAKHPPPGSTPTLPHLSFATDPFMDPDPISPITSDHTSSPTAAALAALSGRDTGFTATSLSPASHSRSGAGRPDISRAGTMRSVTSVTSDMYSDTASVHSARPARMSGASAQVVGNGNRLSGGSFAPGWVVGGREGDPFGDPPR